MKLTDEILKKVILKIDSKEYGIDEIKENCFMHNILKNYFLTKSPSDIEKLTIDNVIILFTDKGIRFIKETTF